MQYIDRCDNRHSVLTLFSQTGLLGFIVYSFDSMHFYDLCDTLHFHTFVHVSSPIRDFRTSHCILLFECTP